ARSSASGGANNGLAASAWAPSSCLLPDFGYQTKPGRSKRPGFLVSQERFELSAKGLRVPCSTAELLAHRNGTDGPAAASRRVVHESTRARAMRGRSPAR